MQHHQPDPLSLDAEGVVDSVAQVIIFIDPAEEAHVDFWRRHNLEAWSMVEAGAAKATDRCAAVSAPWGGFARSIARLPITYHGRGRHWQLPAG